MSPHALATHAAPWVPPVFAAVASVYDLRTREIPDWIPIALLVWAAVALLVGVHHADWLSALGGLALAFGIGALLFYIADFGGGDAKLLGAVGACYGLGSTLPILFWIAIMGGVLAVVALARGKRSLAYAPAIAMGTLIWVVLQEIQG
ncbi:MAG: hypothetical protein EA379_04700 [Phycisphaerales bacterium]|nr:MAG: hypothetical protein EA379_04700 [Phycisphaerales bacterium]